MSEIKKLATREGYGAALKALGAAHDDIIVMDADLAAATKTAVFKKEFPDRFFNAGIAEGNMMGVAAGLAATGKTVFASSFAMFAVGRAFEQIRNSIAYPHLNVKIAATHGGLSVGEDGATHQCNEDFALMRSLPNMTIICPADAVEAEAAVKAAYEHDGPVYLRFGRLAIPVFNDESYEFTWGKSVTLREGKDATIIANGLMVYEALQAADALKEEGINVRVINMHTVKPIDEEAVLKAAEETPFILTAEEHSIIGGLGEAICSFLSEKKPTKVIRVGVNDEFGQSGPAAEVLKLYGLSAENIIKKIKENI